MLSHAILRRPNADDVSRIVLMLKGNMSPSSISAVMRAEGKLLLPRDVSNIAVKERKKSLDGESPMQALIHELERDSNWNVDYETDSEGHITRLFFVHSASRALSLQNHHVFLMDCTYKTNRYIRPKPRSKTL